MYFVSKTICFDSSQVQKFVATNICFRNITLPRIQLNENIAEQLGPSGRVAVRSLLVYSSLYKLFCFDRVHCFVFCTIGAGGGERRSVMKEARTSNYYDC